MISGEDPTATSDFSEIALPFVIAHLTADYPTASEDEIWISATDAILDVCEKPSAIDPRKWTLRRYLKVAATRDLLNLFEAKSRHPNLETVTDPVELSRLHRIGEAEKTGLDEEIAEVVTRYGKELPDELDREIFRLMLEGVRDEETFAHTLGLSNLSKVERSLAVKRTKGRIKAKLRRAGYHVE